MLAAADFFGVLIGAGMTGLVGVVVLVGVIVLTAVGFTELADFFAGDVIMILQVTGL